MHYFHIWAQKFHSSQASHSIEYKKKIKEKLLKKLSSDLDILKTTA